MPDRFISAFSPTKPISYSSLINMSMSKTGFTHILTHIHTFLNRLIELLATDIKLNYIGFIYNFNLSCIQTKEIFLGGFWILHLTFTYCFLNSHEPSPIRKGCKPIAPWPALPKMPLKSCCSMDGISSSISALGESRSTWLSMCQHLYVEFCFT